MSFLGPLSGTSAVAIALGGVSLVYLILTAAASIAKHGRGGLHLFTALLAFPSGAMGSIVGVWNLYLKTWVAFSSAFLLAAGIGLLAKALADIPWTSTLSLIAGIGSGWAVYAFLGSYLPWWAPWTVGVFVFLIIFGMLSMIEGALKLISFILLPRPLTLALAIALAAEAVLVARGTSLWLVL